MALVVMKFGGSSVATPERIKDVAARLVRRHNAGNKVVVAVSAMGDSTDHLLELADAITSKPNKREMDMLLSTGEQVSISLLAMAIEEQGVPAISHTGAQVGIVTDRLHTFAKINQITGTERILKDLDEGKIVIVAGFQGITPDGDITTLGRGGSDTTAVAIAAAIHADVCEICSDVDGVYSADPRICPKAHRLDRLSYDEMLELSANGAGVLNLRAVEFASKYGVVIHALSTFNEAGKGTYIEEIPMDTNFCESPVLIGVAHDLSQAKITMRHVPDHAGIAATVFGKLSTQGVNVDIIIQDVAHDGLTDISFTVPRKDIYSIAPTVDALCKEIGGAGIEVINQVAKVSLVGAGMKSYPGVAAKMFQTLAEEEINISMISTSPICISVVVDADRCADAVRALHTAFGMDDESDEEKVVL